MIKYSVYAHYINIIPVYIAIQVIQTQQLKAEQSYCVLCDRSMFYQWKDFFTNVQFVYHHIQHIEDTVLKDILEGDMSDIDWIILTA